MKIATIFGTRPEIIRLRCVIDVLDSHVDHILIHTGQNFHHGLSRLFFEELELREPDHYLGIEAMGFADQVGRILSGVGKVLEAESPDGVLILGDTNSGLSSIVAKRMGVPVYHMEAGNRCFDDRVPEEVNRKIIDHCSSVLMPYTHRSKENLLAEGIQRKSIFVTGNPIKEVLDRYRERIAASAVLGDLGLSARGFFLATVHRAETVDDSGRLATLVEALETAASRWRIPVVWPVHPRTRRHLEDHGIASDMIQFIEPVGLFDFVSLEQQSRCVLTDSGTVQEECCIFQVPSVTLREVTERPETIECGSNLLAGIESSRVVRGIELSLRQRGQWSPPPEYLFDEVSEVVARVVVGSGSVFY